MQLPMLAPSCTFSLDCLGPVPSVRRCARSRAHESHQFILPNQAPTNKVTYIHAVRSGEPTKPSTHELCSSRASQHQTLTWLRHVDGWTERVGWLGAKKLALASKHACVCCTVHETMSHHGSFPDTDRRLAISCLRTRIACRNAARSHQGSGYWNWRVSHGADDDEASPA
jgi:hypothetical protein